MNIYDLYTLTDTKQHWLQQKFTLGQTSDTYYDAFGFKQHSSAHFGKIHSIDFVNTFLEKNLTF